MRRLFVVAVLSLVAASAFAAVTSITPGLGTTNGGDTVTIVLDQSLPSCVCSPPAYLAEVTFDGVPARSVFAWEKTVYAVTPTHGPGQVTVAVSSSGTPYGTGTFTYHGYGSGLLDSRNYERVLLPIVLPSTQTVPGSFGSQWSGELWVSNPTNYAVELFSDISCTLLCPPILPGEPPYPAVPANRVFQMLPSTVAGYYGHVYYLQKTYANDISFSLHVGDVSRSAENAGTEIGVVRERDFRGSSFDILNVSLDSGSRATLRVYDPDANDHQEVEVSLYSMSDNTLLGSATVPLNVPAKRGTTLGLQFPPYAGFGQIGDLRSGFPAPIPPGRVRVHVTNHTGASRTWGFVAVTNNGTQLITTYRPE